MSIDGGTGPRDTGSNNTNYDVTNTKSNSKKSPRAKICNVKNRLKKSEPYLTIENQKASVSTINISERNVTKKQSLNLKTQKEQTHSDQTFSTNDTLSKKNTRPPLQINTESSSVSNDSSAANRLEEYRGSLENIADSSKSSNQQNDEQNSVKDYESLRLLYNNARNIEKHEELSKSKLKNVSKATLTTHDGEEQEIAYKSAKSTDWLSQQTIKNEFKIFSELDSPYIIKVFPQSNSYNKHTPLDLVTKSTYTILDKETDTFRPPTDLDNQKDAFEILEEVEIKPSGLAMELKQKNLAQASETQTPIQKETTIHDLLQGLLYLKEKGIGHCDIKPENILVDSLGHAVISDAGTGIKSAKRKTPAGTPLYMSPDAYRNFILNKKLIDNDTSSYAKRLKKMPYSTHELDSWGAGICIVLSYCHHLPNCGIDILTQCCTLKDREILAEILNDSNDAKNFKKKFDNVWNTLIDEVSNPIHREIAKGLLQQKWTIKQALDHLLDNSLTFKTKTDTATYSNQTHRNKTHKIDDATFQRRSQSTLSQSDLEDDFEDEAYDKLQETGNLIDRLNGSSNIDIYNLVKVKKTFQRFQLEMSRLGKLSTEGNNTLSIVRENVEVLLSSTVEDELDNVDNLLDRISHISGHLDPKLLEMREKHDNLESKTSLFNTETLDADDYQKLTRLKGNILNHLLYLSASNTKEHSASSNQTTSPISPLKISQDFTQLFHHEFSELIENADDKEQMIHNLRNYMTVVHKQWSDARDSFNQPLKTLSSSNGQEDSLMNNVFKIKDGKISLKKELIDRDSISKYFSEDVIDKNPNTAKKFIMKTNKLLAAMACQSPPCVLTLPKKGSKFNKKKSRAFLNSGSFIDYNVWPTVYLYKGGPILSKGVSQLSNSHS